MTMEIEYLSEEQLASQLRAMYQRVRHKLKLSVFMTVPARAVA